MEFDCLKMYCGLPYEIPTPNGDILVVKQPTVGDIVRLGETEFYGSLNAFVSNTTQYRLQLWKMGIDWNTISDFDLFLLLYKTVSGNVEEMLFDRVCFSNMVIVKKADADDSFMLRDEGTGLTIDKDTYECFHRYLQEMFGMKFEDEFTDDPLLKQWWIDKDEKKFNSRKKNKEKSLSIQPLISSVVNHAGFKYNLKQTMDIGVCEFYDSVRRLQLYEQATAVLKGIFSGMVDSSKIKAEQYNWMKQL